MAHAAIKNTGFVVSFLLVFHVGIAQTLPDFSSIKVDELSDQQIESLLRRTSALGYSRQDLFQLARQQGLSLGEISKLGQRINIIESDRASNTLGNPGKRGSRENEASSSFPEGREDTARLNLDATRSHLFGHSLFDGSRGKLTFQPDLNIPTPVNYILGAGDELYIDIYGASEQYHEAEVAPEGYILLRNIGPIYVAGLTVDEAEKKITNKLSGRYSGLGGANPTTFLQVTLGKIRSIKVNMVGEVKVQGTYTLSSLSTVFNSLYAAGGVTDKGTLRNIKLFRNNELIQVVDAYDFLVNGKTAMNMQLEDQDVIMVEPYSNRVEIAGEVKTPGIFEFREGESLADVLNYAGGFTEHAYRNKVSLIRNVDAEKQVADVLADQFEVFSLKTGDRYTVGRILDRYRNRVQIKGAVYRPGDYAISEGLTVKGLIDRAEGLKGDALMSRAYMVRTRPDLSTETVAFNLQGLLEGSVNDMELRREDIVHIISIYDIREEQYVEIEGEVNNPGIFSFSSGMTAEDLIVRAGGFKTSASAARIEITRRKGSGSVNDISEVITVSVDKDLRTGDGKVTNLEPFDRLTVRKAPGFYTQRFVRVEGEVNFPGKYALRTTGERISDVMKRAGGLKAFAYVKGATLIRKTEFYQEPSALFQRIKDLTALKDQLEQDPNLSEARQNLLLRVREDIDELRKYESNTGEDFASYVKRQRMKELSERNDIQGTIEIGESEPIGIDLDRILADPGSDHDLLLEEGDVIIIPKTQETVRLRGRLLYPTTVRYEENRSARYFINKAGGFGTRAKKGKTYVIYPNGQVAKTKRFLFFRTYPRIEPGTEVIVPPKALKVPVKAQEVVAITSGLATIALLLSQINF